ncbi:2-dehydropantoate 2-reductase [Ponticaulis sp.]|uniref:ketopantoate reductase family protein n=1 Tax=Ponticaulis sp. TaxID=2020902 RepID=UPI000B699869|nr:2-dehydropantoate 2-reductase [Ponticaulis sp.]MAI91249.1 2-dehydropantoate 2-reductase [Ponticaulis sp.]OUX98560.1 MAG: hypothetical protein CBB65_12460 [Hyphomonadaceae bacterium TMED5]|tara:strand:- start:30207 stop:31148 length:942 start_codon:yes stop_codon:yes gene_type:complete
MTSPKIGFAGAGGVGCYFGGRLALAGFDVTLIGRGQHIQAIDENGLKLTLNGEGHVVKLGAADTNTEETLQKLSELDWLFVTCKTYQSEAIMASILPHIGSETKIVSLQNGVDGPLHLSELAGRPVYGGLSIRFVAHVTGPGKVTATGDGYVQMGAYPNGSDMEMSALGEAMQKAGLDFRVSDDIRRELWRKIVINNGVNPICALLQRDCEIVFSNPETAVLVDQMMQETVLAARAEDIHLSDDEVAELRGIIFGLGPVKPSMQVDREQGRQLELDAIAGAIIERAKRYGASAPVTETIYRLLTAELAFEKQA